MITLTILIIIAIKLGQKKGAAEAADLKAKGITTQEQYKEYMIKKMIEEEQAKIDFLNKKLEKK